MKSDIRVFAVDGIDYRAGVQTGYVLVKDGDALLIDASVSCANLQRVLAETGATLRAVLLTHCHFDHCANAAALRSYAPIWAHPYTVTMLQDGTWLAGLPVDVPPVWRPDVVVEDGQIAQIGSFVVRVIFTPGHTADSVCYLVDDALLASGDTLMNDMVCGTAQLPTGDAAALFASGRKLWDTCSDEVCILGGHVSRPDRAEVSEYTPHSTIGRAKMRNWINRL